MSAPAERAHGRLFDQVPDLYDRVRPGYPDELFADLATITSLGAGSRVLEVGCGTGKATTSLADLGAHVTALEPGAALAAVARRRLADRPEVEVAVSTFEAWDGAGAAPFDVVAAASSWHWVDPDVGWRRAHELLRPGGWLALIGHIVVRQPGDVEVYRQTADLHERYDPGNPRWCSPPWEADVMAAEVTWPDAAQALCWFDAPIVRRYETVQWLDGDGFADLLGTTSLYLRLDPRVRAPLLEGIAERIRSRMADRACRRYVTELLVGRRRRSLTRAEAAALVTAAGVSHRAVAPVQARQLTERLTWVSANGLSELTGEPGDWLVTSGDDRWTVAADVFAATYEKLPDGRYLKTAPVRLLRMDEPFVVDSLEGPSAGRAGDYLALGAAGEAWAMPHERVEADLVPL